MNTNFRLLILSTAYRNLYYNPTLSVQYSRAPKIWDSLLVLTQAAMEMPGSGIRYAIEIVKDVIFQMFV